MPATLMMEAHEVVVAELRRLRRERGVTQVELAERLGKPQQFVSLVENGDRRIDLVEFIAFANALGADPIAAFASVVQNMTGPVDISGGRRLRAPRPPRID